MILASAHEFMPLESLAFFLGLLMAIAGFRHRATPGGRRGFWVGLSIAAVSAIGWIYGALEVISS